MYLWHMTACLNITSFSSLEVFIQSNLQLLNHITGKMKTMLILVFIIKGKFIFYLAISFQFKKQDCLKMWAKNIHSLCQGICI